MSTAWRSTQNVFLLIFRRSVCWRRCRLLIYGSDGEVFGVDGGAWPDGNAASPHVLHHPVGSVPAQPDSTSSRQPPADISTQGRTALVCLSTGCSVCGIGAREGGAGSGSGCFVSHHTAFGHGGAAACKPEEAAGGVGAARALGTVEEGYCCEWVAFEGILAKVESVLRCV